LTVRHFVWAGLMKRTVKKMPIIIHDSRPANAEWTKKTLGVGPSSEKLALSTQKLDNAKDIKKPPGPLELYVH
jgi:hypothetical protein